MRTSIILLLLGSCLMAQAHIGSPNVFLEGKAGDYPVRVVIRPPNVVPGLAEITVRLPEPVPRVTVLPVFWKAGRDGAPPPDAARLVRGETNLYAAQLWLMKPGAYSVDVTVEGPRGRGTLIVPVNSIATNTRPMADGFRLMLSVLAIVLFLTGLKIARAIFCEGRLDPGNVPSSKHLRQGRMAMLATAVVLFLLLYAGKSWWEREDLSYRNNALYSPTPVSARVRSEGDQSILNIKVDPAERRGRWTPLIPDHGKLMHLFLVRAGDQTAFAHLHPVPRNPDEFEVPLPPLPAGSYQVYADVTHEDGFSETLVARAEIPAAAERMKRLWLASSGEPICSAATLQLLATNLAIPPDPDDSWHFDSDAAKALGHAGTGAQGATRQVSKVGGGYQMIWENPEPLVRNLDASLRFKLLTPDNQTAAIEPYMGMSGHAIVQRHDGAVFTHIHPVGTFSMAAQQFFVAGKPPKPSTGAPPRDAPTTQPPPLMAEIHNNHTNQASVDGDGEISFPYAFPEPGAYRFWVQMKSQGRILTGVFDTSVAAAK